MWYVCAPFVYVLCICASYMSLLYTCVSLYYTVAYVSWVLGMRYVYCLRCTVGTLYVVSFVCCVLYTSCVSYSVYVGGGVCRVWCMESICYVCISYVLFMLCICVYKFLCIFDFVIGYFCICLCIYL